MPTVSDVLTYARKLAKTDSYGISDTDGTTFINDAIYDFRKKLLQKREDLFVQAYSIDVTTNELDTGASPGIFSFPSDMWLLKNMEINLTDVTNQSLYYEAKQVDPSNLPEGQTWEYKKKNQPSSMPVFDFRGNVFEVAPTPTSSMNNGSIPMTKAIKFFYHQAPTEITSTSATLSFPESLDFRTLAYKVAAIYFSTLGNDADEQKMNTKYAKRVDDLIGVIGTGEQRPIQSVGIKQTGWEY